MNATPRDSDYAAAKAAAEVAAKKGKPSRAEAEEAVRTILRWVGEDPARDGLIETPKRVVKAFNEYLTATTWIHRRSCPRRSRKLKAMTR